MIIDVHQHLYQDNIADHLARTRTVCRKLGIDRICIFGKDNDRTRAAQQPSSWA